MQLVQDGFLLPGFWADGSRFSFSGRKCGAAYVRHYTKCENRDILKEWERYLFL